MALASEALLAAVAVGQAVAATAVAVVTAVIMAVATSGAARAHQTRVSHGKTRVTHRAANREMHRRKRHVCHVKRNATRNRDLIRAWRRKTVTAASPAVTLTTSNPPATPHRAFLPRVSQQVTATIFAVRAVAAVAAVVDAAMVAQMVAVNAAQAVTDRCEARCRACFVVCRSNLICYQVNSY